MLKNLGLMQGRLSIPYKGKIQSFPSLSWENEFKKAKKLSLKFIEWTLDYKNLMKNPLMTLSGQAKIRKLCKKNNITVISITGDCFMQKPFWKAKQPYRKKLISQLKKIVLNASRLKIKYLVIPLVDNGNFENIKQKKILINELNKLNNFLKKTKIQILFETDLDPKENHLFLSNFNKKYFGMNYDIGNSASLDYDPNQEFKEYGKSIKNMHIKDRVKFGNTVPLGKGNAKFKLISKLCRKYNYKGNFIIQAARNKTGEEFETIRNYINFLKKKFA